MEFITFSLAIFSLMLFWSNKQKSKERNFYKWAAVKYMRRRNSIEAEAELTRLFEKTKKDKDVWRSI